MVWPQREAKANASRPTIFAAAWRTRSHHGGDNGNGSKRELPSWSAHCRLEISGGATITVPLPRLPVIPKDVSLCLHDTSSLTTKGGNGMRPSSSADRFLCHSFCGDESREVCGETMAFG